MIARVAKNMALALLLCACASSAQNAALDEGVTLIRAGRFDEALIKLQDARMIEPHNATIENLLGITETQLGKIDVANDHYRAAIAIDASQAAPHRNLGFNLLTAKDYEASDLELRTASRLDPKDPFAHYYLLLLALATGHDADAIAQAAQAGQLPERDAEVNTELAGAEVRLGQADDALRRIESIEQAKLLSASAEYPLALLFVKGSFYSQAVHCFQRIASLDPSWQNRYNLALALLYANQPAEASALLERLHLDQPANADILTSLGSAYEMQQKMPEALEAYRSAAAVDPSNPDRILDYTRVLMDTDKYDEAIQTVQGDMGATEATAPLQLRLGAIQMMKGNYPAARSAFNAALVTDPDLDAAYVGLAQTYAREANDEEALRILKSAREKLPGHYLLEYYFGLLASRQGREQEALVALQNATRMQPSSPEPYFELGKIYEAQNDWSRARESLERVIALAPALSPAHYQLSQVYGHLGMKKEAALEAQKTHTLVDEQRAEVLRKQRERASSFQPQVSASPPAAQ